MNEKEFQKKIGWNPYTPKKHEPQIEILNTANKVIIGEIDYNALVICAGTRFGKSALCAYIATREFVKNIIDILQGKKVKPIHIWIIAPSYDLADKVFHYIEMFFAAAMPSLAKHISRRVPQSIKLPFGPKIECKSGDSPEGMLGEEIDLAIVDECSRLKRKIWESYLFQRLGSRDGKVIFISTPFGKNWFFNEYNKAKEFKTAFHFQSKDNPYYPEKAWENAKARLPKDVFSQEHEALFLDDAATVFRGIRDCIGDCLSDPLPGRNYLMGLDLAKFRDFTVITIIDRATHKVVHFDRFHRLPYTLQKKRVIEAQRKYSARVIIDRMNVGAAFSDELKADGIPILDITATRPAKDQEKATKERLIEKLSVFIEDRNITLPPIDIFIDELESFGYQITDAGNMKYSAPEGLHDDCVMSLAMAVWLLRGKVRTEITKAKRSVPPINKQFQYK